MHYAGPTIGSDGFAGPSFDNNHMTLPYAGMSFDDAGASAPANAPPALPAALPATTALATTNDDVMTPWERLVAYYADNFTWKRALIAVTLLGGYWWMRKKR